MYDFKLNELEQSPEFRNADYETRQQVVQEYLAQNGTDEAIGQFKEVLTDPEFLSLPPEKQQSFKQDYQSFYGLKELPLEDVSFGTDVKDVVLSGLAGTASIPKAAATVAGWLGADQGKEKLLDIAKTTENYYSSKLSSQGKEVKEQKFLSEEDGKWFGNNAIKKVFMTSSESLPLMLATAPVGGALSAGLTKAKFLPNFIRALDGGSKAGKWSHQMLSYGASEAGMSALVSSADAGEKIASMSDSVINKSPVYRELLKTMSPEDARKELRGIVESETFMTQAAATLAGGSIAPGGAMPKLFQGQGKGLFKETVEGFGQEAVQEAGQSGLETIGENLTTRRNIDPLQKLTEGVGESIALGAASGGLMGGGIGGGKSLLTVKQAEQAVADIPFDADPEEVAAAIEQATTPETDEKIILGELSQEEIDDLAAFQQITQKYDLEKIMEVQDNVLPNIRKNNPVVAPHVERILKERFDLLASQIKETPIDQDKINSDNLMDDWAETEESIQDQADVKARNQRFERLKETDPELIANREFTKLEKEGFEFEAPEKTVVGNLKEGDEVVVLGKNGIPDKLTHKGRENGNIVLQDGIRMEVDEFDQIETIAKKEKGGQDTPVDPASMAGIQEENGAQNLPIDERQRQSPEGENQTQIEVQNAPIQEVVSPEPIQTDSQTETATDTQATAGDAQAGVVRDAEKATEESIEGGGQIYPVESAGKPAQEKEPWQMDRNEFTENSLENNKYADQYRNDEELLADFIEDQKLAWRKVVDEAGKDNVLPDNVIDSYVDNFGEQTVRSTFRGVAAKGISQWEPKDVRIWDKTYKEVLKNHTSLTRKGEKKEYHRQAIKRALEQGKPVPPEVLKDYPDLQTSTDKEDSTSKTVSPAPPAVENQGGTTGRPDSRLEPTERTEGTATPAAPTADSRQPAAKTEQVNQQSSKTPEQKQPVADKEEKADAIQSRKDKGKGRKTPDKKPDVVQPDNNLDNSVEQKGQGKVEPNKDVQEKDENVTGKDEIITDPEVVKQDSTPSPSLSDETDQTGESSPADILYSEEAEVNRKKFSEKAARRNQTLDQAEESGLITKEQRQAIDEIINLFPSAWANHFEPRFSNEQMSPSDEQYVAHNTPKKNRNDKAFVAGTLLTEKMGIFGTDSKHLAVMFKGSDIGTFLHEFGEFIYARALTGQTLGEADSSLMNRMYSLAKKDLRGAKPVVSPIKSGFAVTAKGNQMSRVYATQEEAKADLQLNRRIYNGIISQGKTTSKQKNEWFADAFKTWFMAEVAPSKNSRYVSPELSAFFRKVLTAARNVWAEMKGNGGNVTGLEPLFSSMVFNGREINERYNYSSKEAVVGYVIGAVPTHSEVLGQGFHDNSKTYTSFDPGTICPKQKDLVDFALQHFYNGRTRGEQRSLPETDPSWDELSKPAFWAKAFDQAKQAGVDVPCVYCYVEGARLMALEKQEKGRSINSVNFAMAKKVTESVEYVDKLVAKDNSGNYKIPQSKIDDMNLRGGLRMFSFSDYIRELHKDSIARLLRDAAERGLGVKAITKNPQFVEDFADTGIIINLSIDERSDGSLGGMPWKTAADLKIKHPSVKIRTVAVNTDNYKYFAKIKDHLGVPGYFVDIITPYHGKVTEGSMWGGMPWENLDHKTNKGKSLSKYIKEDPDGLDLKRRTCCQVGGKCYLTKHHEQCGANCAGFAGNLTVPQNIQALPPGGSIPDFRGAKLSQSQTSQLPPTEQAKISELTKPQQAIFKRLQDSGKLELIDNEAALELLGDSFQSTGGKVEGFYLDGKSYLILENIKKGELWSKTLHEVGIHAQKGLMDNKGFQSLLNSIESRKDEDSVTGRAIRDAAARVPDDTIPEHINEEILAYMVSSGQKISIVNRFISFLKNMLVKLGMNPKMFTATDMTALADSAVRREAKTGSGINQFAQSIKMSVKQAGRVIANLPAFNKWFGDSKVVDEDGNPLVVYHGTKKSFKVFKDSLTNDGIFFTPDAPKASAYAEGINSEGANVIPAYIRIENPFVVDAKGSMWGNIKLPKIMNPDLLGELGSPGLIGSWARANGYDGAIIKNVVDSMPGDPPTTHIAVFSPLQIKSIFNDKWDSSNPDIMLSVATNKKNLSVPKLSVATPLVNLPPTPTQTQPDAVDRFLARHPKLANALEESLYGIVDKDDPRRRVMNRAKKVGEDTDILMVERLRGKATAEEVLRFEEEKVEPLKKHLAKNNLHPKDLDEYSHGMHTPERNLRMQQVNAKGYIDQIKKHLNTAETQVVEDEMITIRSEILMSSGTRAERQDRYIQVLDGLINGTGAMRAALDAKQQQLDNRVFTQAEIAKGTPENLQKKLDSRRNHIDEIEKLRDRWQEESVRYAGITDNEAKAIVDKWKADPRYQAMKKAHEDLKAINQMKLDVLYSAGQLTREEYNSLTDGYKHYVPLMRDVEDSGRPSSGRITGPTGHPLKVAKGSMKEVVHIMANSIRNTQNAINIKHKSLAGIVLYNFVKENPDCGITLDKQTKTPSHDKEGNIVLYSTPKEEPNQLYIRVVEEDSYKNGDRFSKVERYTLTFDTTNKTTARFLQSIKDTDANMVGPLRALAKVTRFLAMINTTLAPPFIISNFVRDIQTAGIHMEDSAAKGLQGKVLKGVFPAIKGILKAEYGNDNSYWGRVYRDFAKHGGKIGWMQSYDNVDDLAKNIDSTMDLYRKGHITKKSLHFIGKAVSSTNMAVENGVRLAVYDQLLKVGQTPKQAALAASNLTVDFTRRGAYSPMVNAAYMFFNAGVQGNVRIIKAAYRSPKVRAIIGGIIATGFALQMLAYGTGGEDETGEPYIDGIPDFIKERNMIFMKPGGNGEHIKLPSPYGYNVFYNVGTEIARALHSTWNNKKYNAGEGGMRLLNVAMGSFNPLQSASIAQTLAPTLADPFVMVGENLSWSGQPIMPTEGFGVGKADAYRHFKSAHPISKSIAQGLHRLTGGKGEYDDSALMDISPETLELIYDTFTGSAGRFIKDTITFPFKLADKEKELEANKIPMLSKVYGTWTDRAISERYYKQVEQVERFKKNFLAADKERRVEMKRNSMYNAVGATKDAESLLKKLRTVRDKLSEAGRPTDLIEKKILKVQTEYLKKVKE